MIILGINAYHGDSSAALIVDGKLDCAIEEERIRRIKHWAGVPTKSIKWCLDYKKMKLGDVDYIAISRDPMSRIHKKLIRIMLNGMSRKFLKERMNNYQKIGSIKNQICEHLGADVKKVKARIVNVEHHSAHIASSFFVSPFKKSVIVSVDGFGDFASAAYGIGEENKIKIKKTVLFPNSLGIFFTAMTQYLGFPYYGDEYKVMGMAALGKPKFLDQCRKVVKLKDDGLFELDTSYFLHDSKGVEMSWLNEQPVCGRIYSDKMNELFDHARENHGEITDRHYNIAASVQVMYEEAFFHLLNKAYDEYGIESIALAGGCLQNSLANGKIYNKTKFKKIYIPPAAHDGGGSIGAALYLWNQKLGNKRSYILESPYLGPEFGDEEIQDYLKQNSVVYDMMETEALMMQVSRDLTEGKILGWFQGRTEWGPRALGNRSIIVDPRNKNMKDILNKRIKKREKFRPFAPSILEEHVSEWFEGVEAVPFMEKVYMIKEEQRDKIPAVVHEDGTGRLQTVSKKENVRYYQLINAFYEITQVPILLNTSFNENEPIVNTPAQALDCFRRSGMDILVLGNCYIRS